MAVEVEYEFPSPYGVLLFSTENVNGCYSEENKVSVPLRGLIIFNLTHSFCMLHWGRKFPSPYGVLLFSTWRRLCAQRDGGIMFPSPYGVLLFSTNEKSWGMLHGVDVSVPLRGLIIFNVKKCGNCKYRAFNRFPSPYGVLLFSTCLTMTKNYIKVSVPLRGLIIFNDGNQKNLWGW